ncbi:MAG: TetR/AcrR family transcriptional regulator [Gammaproteobacteria bacterium]|nr:TetR/AcrR family transcriptional regulator [Gammaproteobacteria bacterium]
MPRTSDKRERLITAAKTLFHEQGLAQTTLADIAATARVALGNVYYYFKTKDDIASAVIAERAAEVRDVLDSCDCASCPRECVVSVLKKMRGRAAEYVDKGCPVGALCQELGRSDSPLTDQAYGLVRAQIDWLTDKFGAMGRRDARDLAVQLVSEMQGVSLTARAIGDARLLRRQLDRLIEWVETL